MGLVSSSRLRKHKVEKLTTFDYSQALNRPSLIPCPSGKGRKDGHFSLVGMAESVRVPAGLLSGSRPRTGRRNEHNRKVAGSSPALNPIDRKELVEKLKQLLEELEAGKLAFVAIAVLRDAPNDEYTTSCFGYANDAEIRAIDHVMATLDDCVEQVCSGAVTSKGPSTLQ